MGYNALNASRRHQLNLWFVDNLARFEGMTKQAVADLATTEKGFDVSVGNIEGCERATGETWRKLPTNFDAASRAAVMEEAVAALRVELDSTKETVERICTFLKGKQMQLPTILSK
jgi:hypothetical protein